MPYAENTRVPPEESRMHIERLIRKAGGTHFAVMTAPSEAVVAFVLRGRQVRFNVPMPARGAAEREEWRRWRCLLLSIKGKLSAVEDGITTFDAEFLAHIVVPGDGRTVGETMVPELDRAYQEKRLPPLLGPVRVDYIEPTKGKDHE